MSKRTFDQRDFRAFYGRSAADIATWFEEVDMEPALQRVGDAALDRYRADDADSQATLRAPLDSLANQLDARRSVGDDLLAKEIRATLRGEEPTGRPLKVSLDELAEAMFHSGEDSGGYLNLETGEAIPAVLTNSAWTGEDAVVDVEDDDSWWYVDSDGHDEWRDMESFANSVEDETTRLRLLDAIHGSGAFSRFRRMIHQTDLGPIWHAFSSDIKWGAARELLASKGIRPI